VTFLVGAYFFYRARNQYSGEMGKVVRRLVFVGVIGFLASAVRYAGDILVLWKWAESLGYVIFGIANVYAVWPLLTYVMKTQAATSDQTKR
jgi:hypothetical protein